MFHKKRKNLKTDFELEKLLWRYHHGLKDKMHISCELNNIVDQLADRRFELNHIIDIIRRYRQDELIKLGKLSGEIVRHVEQAEFEAAVDKIKSARAIFTNLENTADVFEEYDSTGKSIDQLKALTGNGLFADTPTFKIINQLHQKTGEYLDKNAVRKARLNIFVCRVELKDLLETDKNDYRAKKMEKKLDKFSEILEHVHKVKSLEFIETYFSKINCIRQLIKSNYIILAKRFIDEFGIEISDKKLFFTEYQKAYRILKPQALAKMISSGNHPPGNGKNACDDIAIHLMEKRIKAGLNQLKKVGDQISNFLETNNKKEEK